MLLEVSSYINDWNPEAMEHTREGQMNRIRKVLGDFEKAHGFENERGEYI